MKTKMKLNFSTITKVENTLFENVSKIVVNGGGGMGGTHEEILCNVVTPKNEPHGFMVVKEIISGDVVEINPSFIGTIRKVNMTKVYFEHTNSNFPSGKRTEWYTHKVGTEIEFMKEEDYNNSPLSVGGGGMKLIEYNY